MKRPKGTPLYEYPPPQSMKFVLFKASDEKAWAEIETSAGEFEREVDALAYFQTNFLPYAAELEQRCLFLETEAGKKVATLSLQE